MWHLHIGGPGERCVAESERRADLVQRAMALPKAILCESVITSAACQKALAALVAERAEAAKG